MSNTKYIFISGGVISGLGKGVTSASLALMLKNRGYSINPIKCETYLNVDSGTINPIEHGDAFLCADGLEADMDLGTYERFLGQEMGKINFITMGRIYKEIIDKERNMGYGGKTVDAIPTIPNAIIQKIKECGTGFDFCFVELGGTAGEYQNVYNFESARMLKLEMPKNVIHIHISYVPVPEHLGEPKTKPTQLSMRFLNMAGIQPEFLVLRSNLKIDEVRKEKIAVQCNLSKDQIFLNPDLDSIYDLPEIFAQQKFDEKILSFFNLKPKKLDLKDWKDMTEKLNIVKNKKEKLNICVVGKYLATGDYELPDAYDSLSHALKHASLHTEIGINIKFLNSQSDLLLEDLKSADGVIVPIGWGERGTSGKIEAIRYARENKVPYLGLCYGMQLALVEYARNVLKLEDANSEEINPKAKELIIHSIPFDSKYQIIKGEGTSMRLGTFSCDIKKGTLAEKIYRKYNYFFADSGDGIRVLERHRHRYEFNNAYRKALEEGGMVFSGTSPDDFFVEMVELPSSVHPFFLATQAHPEYKSTPLNPHPFFMEFLNYSAKKF